MIKIHQKNQSEKALQISVVFCLVERVISLFIVTSDIHPAKGIHFHS